VGDPGILPEPAGCSAKACSELIIIISFTALGPFSSRALGTCRLSQPALTFPLLLGCWSVMEWGEEGGQRLTSQLRLEASFLWEWALSTL